MMGTTCPKTPTPNRKACFVTSQILRRTWSTVTVGFVIFYRVAYLLFENIIRLILWPSTKWEGAFVISCIAVSLDPLFFYIPIIDETNKCLGMDKTLRTTALILRLLTDIPLTLHFIAQICHKVDTDHPNLFDSDSDNSDFETDSDSSSDSGFFTTSCSLQSVTKRTAKRFSASVVINFLAVLPIPQAAIIVGFFRMRGSSSTEVFLHRTILNVSLVLGYLPRVCQIYLSSQHFRMGGIWIKPSLNLFLYIISGHVFAAFWYFLAIERVTSCWHQACRNTPGCVATFDCSSTSNTPINTTVLNQLCPINSPNTTIFDFGIYLPVLQSRNTGSVQFLTKLFYCLWWGVRNLSNFGTNLETSSYMWENCFAILICISGLLLFLYLIGNMQKYMELATTKWLKSEQSRRDKIRAKNKQIKEWMSRNGISVNMRKKINNYIKQYHIVENNIKADVDVTFFLNGDRFPNDTIRQPLLKYLVQNAVIKNVPQLQKMDERVLKILCEYMKSVIFQENDYIVEEGGQLVQMIFIIQGEIKCPKRKHLKKDNYYGRRIQSWALRNYTRSFYDPLPTSTGGAKCIKKVEAFALDAFDLLHFAQQNSNLLNISPDEPSEKFAPAPDNNIHHHPLNQDEGHKPWERPKRGLVKLNCSTVWDAASKRAGMGWVCRNHQGAFMVAGSSAASPFSDAFLAEASGMATAIEFCSQHINLKAGIGIVVESDNQDLINCLNEPPFNSNLNRRVSETLRPILDKILNLATKFKPRSFMRCNRQRNTVANGLANHGFDAVEAWCDGPPAWLKPALKKDSPDYYRELDEELGWKNDFQATSPADAAHDFEDIHTRMAEESQA